MKVRNRMIDEKHKSQRKIYVVINCKKTEKDKMAGPSNILFSTVGICGFFRKGKGIV